MKRIFILTLLLVVSASIASNCRAINSSNVKGDFFAASINQKSVGSPHNPLPAPKGLVSDLAGVLNQAAKDQLERTLVEFKQRSQIDFAVVTVNTTGSQSIFDYSLAVAREWGIGANNPDKAGVLLLIAVNDRKWHIQISRALEKILSNEDVAQLGSVMNVPFREGQYGEGIIKCVDVFVTKLIERRARS